MGWHAAFEPFDEAFAVVALFSTDFFFFFAFSSKEKIRNKIKKGKTQVNKEEKEQRNAEKNQFKH